MLELTDVKNRLFVMHEESVRQTYIDEANNEIRDMAKTFGINPDDIVEPLHTKLVTYGSYYAVMRLSEDFIGVNNNSGFSGGDVYESTFKRMLYRLQTIGNEITPIMFTGEDEDNENRAVVGVTIYRG